MRMRICTSHSITPLEYTNSPNALICSLPLCLTKPVSTFSTTTLQYFISFYSPFYIYLFCLFIRTLLVFIMRVRIYTLHGLTAHRPHTLFVGHYCILLVSTYSTTALHRTCHTHPMHNLVFRRPGG